MVTNPRSELLLIGELSKRTGVHIETIRYYERAGLLPPPPRTRGGRRAYGKSHVQRLIFVRRSRELGFSLEDTRALLDLAAIGNAGCRATKDLTLRHLQGVRGKLTSLRRLERALEDMTSACQPDRQRSCPIIAALAAPSKA